MNIFRFFHFEIHCCKFSKSIYINVPFFLFSVFPCFQIMTFNSILHSFPAFSKTRLYHCLRFHHKILEGQNNFVCILNPFLYFYCFLGGGFPGPETHCQNTHHKNTTGTKMEMKKKKKWGGSGENIPGQPETSSTCDHEAPPNKRRREQKEELNL